MSTRARTRFRCDDCGSLYPVWNGRCASCGNWDTLIEEPEPVSPRTTGGALEPSAMTELSPLAELSAIGARPLSVGVPEVDRVLNGGLVPGSVTLLSGPPGVGKSTLALQMAIGMAAGRDGTAVVYLTAEETIAQLRLRADRLRSAVPASLSVTDTVSVETVLDAIERYRPALAIVDSIQTIADPALGAAPGTVAQVRGCAQRLSAAARAAGTSLVLVGHVTKDGAIAGPKSLEHLVDTVVTFDADLEQGLRFLRATKHRHGSVGELGVFTMSGAGLVGVADVAEMFLSDRRPGVAGSIVTPVLQGRRSLLVEVQALVDPAATAGTVRVCQGTAKGRVELIRAVLGRHLGITGDVYCSAAGGLQISGPSADLAIALAVVSAATGRPVPSSTVACGEVGLAGEVRGAPSMDRRLGEAVRLGFTKAVVPSSTPTDAGAPGIQLCRVGDLRAAVEATFDEAISVGGRHGRHVVGNRLTTVETSQVSAVG